MSFVSGCCFNRWDTLQMDFSLGSTRSGCKMDHWAPWTPPWLGTLSMKWDWECLLHRAMRLRVVVGTRPTRVPEVLKCWFPVPETDHSLPERQWRPKRKHRRAHVVSGLPEHRAQSTTSPSIPVVSVGETDLDRRSPEQGSFRDEGL